LVGGLVSRDVPGPAAVKQGPPVELVRWESVEVVRWEPVELVRWEPVELVSWKPVELVLVTDFSCTASWELCS